MYNLRHRRRAVQGHTIIQPMQTMDRDGLSVEWINGHKGRGVFATKAIYKGEFITEYRGDLLSKRDAEMRCQKNISDVAYMYYFKHQGKNMCIDASKEDGSIGRLVNDNISSVANCRMRIIVKDSHPHLCLYATKNILQGDELEYDYGGYTPWRKKTTSKDNEVHVTEKNKTICEANDEIVTENSKTICEANDEIVTENSKESISTSTSTSFTEDTGGELYFDADLGKYHNSLLDILNKPCQESHPELQPIFERMLEQMKAQVPKRLKHLSHMQTTDYDSEECTSTDEEDFSDDYLDAFSESESSTDEESEEESSENEKPSTSKNHSGGVKVSSTYYSKSRKRTWNRQHCCLFCEQNVTKLPRHLETHHADEILVMKAMLLPKRSAERNAILEEIRKKGDNAYNCRVLKEGKGKLLVYKRPKLGTMHVEDYIPCPDCQGYFAKKSLWRHQKKCTLKKAKENPTTSRTAQCQKAGRALLPTKSPCSAKLQEILAGMRTDSVVVTIRADSWICKLGEHHCDDSSTINHNIVSERMRRIARLLLETQQINASIKSAKDLVDPAHFDDVILGVNICSGFDTSNQNFEAPTLAKKLGQSLTTLAEIVIAESIKSSDTLQECKAEQFLKLKNLQWKQRIATKVYKQQCKQKWQKPKKVPLTADTVKLNQLLTNQVCTTKEKLQGNEVSTSTWRELASLTLAQLIMFNRRRPGETQYLRMSDYLEQTKKKREFQDEIFESLPIAQKLAAKRLTLIMTRGKRDRGVPILLTPDMADSVKVLNKTRQIAGVDPQNPYIFACPSGNSVQPLRGYDCLHKYAHLCGAKNPDRLTATNLRKHLATLSQILNLSNTELEQLANHLGHDVTVHKQYYRLPQDVIFLAKVSKLLLTAEKGKLHEFKGRSLEEVEIEESQLLSDIEMSDGNESDNSESKEPTKALPTKRVKISKTMWTKEEETAVINDPCLRKAINAMHPPVSKDCLQAKLKNSCLKRRSIVQIKSKVWNIIQKNKREQMKY
ncbi:uncharacterized protein [Apostichopus japonicus]|uniref:uncharacterized protein isoform X3 n=1 Tax=Stichopus japonicus TaxID=307972 RepID=UPI003AB7CCEE